MNAVEVHDLTFSYGSSERRILDGISFSVPSGSIFVIAGLSGCGKSTLCHILTGLIPHSVSGTLSGSVLLSGRPIRSPSDASDRIGLVFQDSDAQIITTTVEDELAFALENACVPPEEMRRSVDAMAQSLGLYDTLTADPAALSGGQKKLLCIGSVLISEPDIIVLDEPFGSLDSVGRELVRHTILSLADSGKTVILVEHDLTLVDFADTWMLLRGGKVAAMGSPKSLDRSLLKSLEMWFD